MARERPGRTPTSCRTRWSRSADPDCQGGMDSGKRLENSKICGDSQVLPGTCNDAVSQSPKSQLSSEASEAWRQLGFGRLGSGVAAGAWEDLDLGGLYTIHAEGDGRKRWTWKWSMGHGRRRKTALFRCLWVSVPVGRCGYWELGKRYHGSCRGGLDTAVENDGTLLWIPRLRRENGEWWKMEPFGGL